MLSSEFCKSATTVTNTQTISMSTPMTEVLLFVIGFGKTTTRVCTRICRFYLSLVSRSNVFTKKFYRYYTRKEQVLLSSKFSLDLVWCYLKCRKSTLQFVSWSRSTYLHYCYDDAVICKPRPVDYF